MVCGIQGSALSIQGRIIQRVCFSVLSLGGRVLGAEGFSCIFQRPCSRNPVEVPLILVTP